MKNGYPFPEFNFEINFENLFINKNDSYYDVLLNTYKRITGTQLMSLKLQYIAIENILLESFNYVTPIAENIQTSSAKFATIIRESCNLFEHISRLIYSYIFNFNGHLNIYNYLSLEKYLKFNSYDYISPSLQSINERFPDVLMPFLELNGWDKNSEISRTKIPTWWLAYNNIKHSTESSLNDATLYNSIRSLTAAYIFLNIYADANILSDTITYPEIVNNEIMERQIPNNGSKLFCRKDLAFSLIL